LEPCSSGLPSFAMQPRDTNATSSIPINPSPFSLPPYYNLFSVSFSFTPNFRLAILYSRLRKRSPIHQHPVAEAAVVALICSCINYLVVYLRGDQVTSLWFCSSFSVPSASLLFRLSFLPHCFPSARTAVRYHSLGTSTWPFVPHSQTGRVERTVQHIECYLHHGFLACRRPHQGPTTAFIDRIFV
jgi:hypothetical protein